MNKMFKEKKTYYTVIGENDFKTIRTNSMQ